MNSEIDTIQIGELQTQNEHNLKYNPVGEFYSDSSNLIRPISTVLSSESANLLASGSSIGLLEPTSETTDAQVRIETLDDIDPVVFNRCYENVTRTEFKQIHSEIKQRLRDRKKLEEDLRQKRQAVRVAEKIRELFASLPEDSDAQITSINEIMDAVKNEAAKRMQQPLNTIFRAMPSSTFEEKVDTARQINERLKNAGLRILWEHREEPGATEVEVLPGRLIANNARTTDKAGRYRIECTKPDGREVTFLVGNELPDFVFAPAPLRREALSHQERVARSVSTKKSSISH